MLLCCSSIFVACSEDASENRDIQVGADDLKEVKLNKLTTRTIILRGGNGKYIANVADSKIAGVSISKEYQCGRSGAQYQPIRNQTFSP